MIHRGSGLPGSERPAEPPAPAGESVGITLRGAWGKAVAAGAVGVALGGGGGIPAGLALGGPQPDAVSPADLEHAILVHSQDLHPGAVSRDEWTILRSEIARVNLIVSLLAQKEGISLPD